MATALCTITIDNFPAGIDNSQRVIYVSGTIAIQAGPATYLTGGLALNWQAALDASGQLANLIAVGPGGLKPFMVWLSSGATAGTTVGGFGYVWNKASNTLQLLASSGTQTAGTGTISQEMTNTTAIPASVSNDVIRFEAIFVRSFN